LNPLSTIFGNLILDRGRILTAPYEERDGWEMNVMDVNGTMYFEEHLSDAQLLEKYTSKFTIHIELLTH